MAEATATPVELTLKTGEVIKAANYEEALKIAVGMAENTKDVYKDEKAKREALEAQVASLSSQVASLNRPAPVANGQFDKDRYYKLLNEDPIQAQNYVDGARFGIEASQVPTYFQQMNQTVSEVRQNMVAGQFLAQHAEDFPAESAPLLTKKTEELLSQGIPYTVDTVNLAYSQLVASGQIKPNVPKPNQQNEEANPSLVGGGGDIQVTADDDAKMAAMSMSELTAYMRSKGVQGI